MFVENLVKFAGQLHFFQIHKKKFTHIIIYNSLSIKNKNLFLGLVSDMSLFRV